MNIGYACIALGVPGTALRQCTLKFATEERLREITAANLHALETMVQYNVRMGIRLLRISSEVIPLGSHPVNQEIWWEEHGEDLRRIGGKIKAGRLRVSMHPGQYTVLNSPEVSVAENAVRDLTYHARFLDALGVDSTNKIILHIGGVYGDKPQAVQRFLLHARRLPDAITGRLALENDERCFTVDDLLDIGKALNLPVVFDTLHHALNPAEEALSENQWILRCGQTWKPRDGRQKIHYAQQELGGRPGAHSANIGLSEFLTFVDALKGNYPDIMLEVKNKNLSAVKCIYATTEKLQVQQLEEEWAHYKYLVLEHSPELYQEIGRLFRENNITAVEYYQRVDKALAAEVTVGDAINAAEYLGGYFMGCATVSERQRFELILERYKRGKGTLKAVKNHLWKMSVKYAQEYLLKSYYFL